MTQKKSRMKFAVIGFGIFGVKRLVPGFSLSTQGTIHAITKRNKKAAEKHAKKHNIPLAYTYEEIDDLLQNEDIKAVAIATPNALHKRDTIKALKAKKHVLLEKPMGMNARECQEMAKIAKETKTHLMVAHCLRFNDTVNFFKKTIESGELGDLVSLTADYCFNGHQSSREWLFSKRLAGGGAAFDIGVHAIDTIRYISGKDVISAEAISFPRSKERKSDEVETNASFHLKMSDNVAARAFCSFETNYHTFLEAIGTKGTIRAHKWTLIDSDVEVVKILGDKKKSFRVRNENQYARQIDAFVDAINGERKNPIPPAEGVINQRIIDLVNRQD